MNSLYFVLSLFIIASSAYQAIDDPSITNYNGNGHFTFKPFDKSAQFTLVPCEGKMTFNIGTSSTNQVVACETQTEDKMCRYEYLNTLDLDSTIYIDILADPNFDAKFDFIASSEIGFFDSVNPPTSSSSVTAFAYFVDNTTVVANVTWPDAFAAGSTAVNNYTIYTYGADSPTITSDHYSNTSCGIRNFMNPVSIYSLSTVQDRQINVKYFRATNLPINPNVYTFFTVVADRIDASSNLTFSSAYAGTWVAPNSASPYVPPPVVPSSTGRFNSGSEEEAASGSATTGLNSSNAVVVEIAYLVVLVVTLASILF